MNLLTDPLIRVETSDGMVNMSLPELLAALGEDKVASLPGLQRHQEDAFHIFLCYVAGAVLARESRQSPSQTADFWRQGIRRLTGRDDDCAWTLIVTNLNSPGFMQPAFAPKACSSLRREDPKAITPDELDVLQAAKNHDVKRLRAVNPHLDAWVFALVSLQTMTGQMGRGNYGIARMNRGTGSRTYVGLVYDVRPGGRWSRDTRRLLSLRNHLIEPPWPYRPDGLVFTWCRPWDLKTPISLSDLDPFFIESARAIRLDTYGDRVVALGAGSTGCHIDGQATKGVLGDPWTPVVLDGPKAWTVTDPFLTPEKLRNLIFEDGFEPLAMLRPDPGMEGQRCSLRASVLAPAGMGRTDGFHAAEIPIPSQAARRLFTRGPDRDRLALLSKTAVNDAGQMQNRVLKLAVLSLLEAGPEQVNFDRREISEWWKKAQRQFSASWHADFFPWLWHTLEHADPEAARHEWLQALRDKALAVLNHSIDRYPDRAGRRYRARVRASGMFMGSLYKNFPELKEGKSEDTPNSNHANEE